MDINKIRLALAGHTLKEPGLFNTIEEVYSSIKPAITRDMDKELDRLTNRGISMVDFFSKEYPESLRNIENPPLVLFVKGELRQTELSIAVVGTRHPSGYGEKVVKYLVPYLVRAGFAIVSGMATGIDALAHEEALKENGYTIAVLGSGIDVIYPRSNATLYKHLSSKGCIVSEFPPSTPPLKQNFPRRNRIIAGLARATLVVEADIKSGSLITARLTEEQSKPVFAVPGEIFSKRSRGTNLLLNKGAIAVNDVDAILSYFYIELKRELERLNEHKPQMSKNERLIIDALKGEMSIDELVIETGMDVATLSSLLFDLELKGIIKRSGADTYMKL